MAYESTPGPATSESSASLRAQHYALTQKAAEMEGRALSKDEKRELANIYTSIGALRGKLGIETSETDRFAA